MATKPTKSEEIEAVKSETAKPAVSIDHHAAEKAHLHEQLANAHKRIEELKAFIRESVQGGINYTKAHEQLSK